MTTRTPAQDPRAWQLTDYDAAPPEPTPLTLREQILWTLFGLALLAAFIVLLVEDQLA